MTNCGRLHLHSVYYQEIQQSVASAPVLTVSDTVHCSMYNVQLKTEEHRGGQEKKIEILLSSGQVLFFPRPTSISTCPLGKLERTERTGVLYGLSKTVCPTDK